MTPGLVPNPSLGIRDSCFFLGTVALSAGPCIAQPPRPPPLSATFLSHHNRIVPASPALQSSALGSLVSLPATRTQEPTVLSSLFGG